jgi:hypothetical protein
MTFRENDDARGAMMLCESENARRLSRSISAHLVYYSSSNKRIMVIKSLIIIALDAQHRSTSQMIFVFDHSIEDSIIFAGLQSSSRFAARNTKIIEEKK